MRRAALVAALALAAGCGSGDDEEASTLLDRGFATDVKSGVATLDAELDLEVEGAQEADETLRLTLEGPFEATSDDPTDLPDLDMDFRASGAGRDFAGRVVLTRDNAWVEYEGTTYEVGEELWTQLRQALDQQSQGKPKTFAQADIDPLDWVDGAEVEGEERVSGVRTTKVGGTLDMEALLRDSNELGAGVSEDQLRAVDEVLEDVDFEAWIGADDIWRRVVAATEFSVPEEQRETVGGIEGGSFELDLELAEPNEPVEIEEPAGGARALDELLRRLGIPPESLFGPGFAQPAPG